MSLQDCLSAAVIPVSQFQPPGIRKLQAESFSPFHDQDGADPQCFLLFLQEQVIGSGGKFQSVEIEVNKRWFALRVVLRQGEGWAGDRFLDTCRGGQALHQ